MVNYREICRKVLELPMKKVRKEKIEYMSNEADKDGRISGPFVTLRGKGSKLRNINLSPKTAKLIQAYLNEFHPAATQDAPLFYTRRSGSLWPLSVDSVSRVLKENADKARLCVTDIPERVHCHLLRKSRAMHLYVAGVPLPAIMELLGHASMNTTSGFYAFVTWEMVSEAMQKANEDHLDGEMLWKKADIIKQLYSFQVISCPKIFKSTGLLERYKSHYFLCVWSGHEIIGCNSKCV